MDIGKIVFAPSQNPANATGCQPLKHLTEDDVRRIVREELGKSLSQRMREAGFKSKRLPPDDDSDI